MLELVALVLAVDAIAIAVYFTTGFGRRPPDTRLLFTGLWMFATLLIAIVGLSRIRRARLRTIAPPR